MSIELKRTVNVRTSMESDLAFGGFTFLMYKFCWRLAAAVAAAETVATPSVVDNNDCMGCTVVGVGVGVGGSMLKSWCCLKPKKIDKKTTRKY